VIKNAKSIGSGYYPVLSERITNIFTNSAMIGADITRSGLCGPHGSKGFLAFNMRIIQNIRNKISIYKLFRVRKRYLLTRSNRLRARYGVLALAMGVLISGLVLRGPSSLDYTGASDLANLETSAGYGVAMNEQGDSDVSRYASVLPDNLIDMVRISPNNKAKTEEPKDKNFTIKSGQTVAGILQNAGVSGAEAYKIVQALSEYVDVRKIRAGQSFKARFKPSDNSEGNNDEMVLASMSMDIDALKSVHIHKEGEDFSAQLSEKKVEKRLYAGATEIQTSLYGSAARSGIPSQVIAKMIRMYSWSVDFQRDIRRDDRIELLYEVYETEDGEPVKYGEIQYANLSVGGIDLPLYRFDKEGKEGYFDKDGVSVKKTLMKTPVDGARVSSGYGMRKHPILGYGKMHKGVDFAAPVGTPVYAAGDGVLEKVGRNGGYGNYIRLRHNSRLKTAYAHLHKFASGISAGKRVKQGQVIAYIGTTGRSTGPHLHYEVLLNNKQVNPNRVDLPVGESLKGQNLKTFQARVEEIQKQYKSLLNDMKFAYSQGKENDKNKAG